MPPQLHLRRIREEGESFDHELSLEDLEDENGSRLVPGPARFLGEVRRGDRGIDLRGRLEAHVHPLCVRCLETYEIPLDLPVRLILVEESTDEEAGEMQISEDDSRLFQAPEGKADLTAIAREQVWLGLPLKPVCRPDCRGLCPTCGRNRNRIECGCSEAEVDPRLAPLLQWKEDHRGG